MPTPDALCPSPLSALADLSPPAAPVVLAAQVLYLLQTSIRLMFSRDPRLRGRACDHYNLWSACAELLIACGKVSRRNLVERLPCRGNACRLLLVTAQFAQCHLPQCPFAGRRVAGGAGGRCSQGAVHLRLP